MHWLLAALAGAGFVELLVRLPILPKLAEFRAIVMRVFRVVRSDRISDHWKEKALLEYAGVQFWLTLSIGVYLIGACAPFLILFAFSRIVDIAFMEFAMSTAGIIFMTMFSICYAKLRF